MMNMNKMKEAFSDEEFVKALFDLETPEEVQAALAEKEIELSTEEICQMRDILNRHQNGELTEAEQEALEMAEKSENGELSEEELESVAGGGVMGIVFLMIVLVGGAAGYAHDSSDGRW